MIYKTVISLIIIVLVNLVVVITPVIAVDKESIYDISIDMVRRYKILPGDDKPYCVAEKDEYIYVTGIGNNGVTAYVFKIDKEKGYIQKSWNTYKIHKEGCLIELHDCGFIGDHLYVIGTSCANLGDDNWLILVFNENLTQLFKAEENPTAKADWAHAFASDGEYLYVVGAINGTGVYKTVMLWQWRVEKRRLDLSMVSSYTSRDIYGGRPFDAEINPITNHLWIVGTNRRIYEKMLMWSILILDKTLKPIKELNLSELQGQALTICFDRNGYGYIGGDDAVIKMDKNGNILKIQEYRNISFSKSLCIDNNTIFMVGDILRLNKTRHQIAVLMDTDLNILSIKILHDPTNATSSYFDIGSLAFDGRYIYVAGYEEVIRYNNTFGWVIYKLSLRRNGEIITASPRIIRSVSSIDSRQYNILPYIALTAIVIVLVIGYIAIRYRPRRKLRYTRHRKSV